MTATHRAFFGDGEHDFRLTPPVIEELEALTGNGIGTIVNRVSAGHFKFVEIVETIRLALIGAGTLPEDAARLVRTYVAAQPLAASHILAIDILGALWSGKLNQEAAE